MAFYKVRKKKMTGLFYPESVTVGKQVTTSEIAAMLADRSTVTRADTLAVLSDLGTVLGIFMSQGRSVKLEGIGSFRYTISAKKQGVEKEEEAGVSQIKSVRVRFMPEMKRNADNTVATRSMLASHIDWVKWDPKEDEKKAGESEDPDTGGGDSGGDSTGTGEESNPL